MQKPLLLILSLSVAAAVQAQRVSHTFRDVTMPEALHLLGGKTSRYTINFIYNDLEDFRVTSTIKNLTIPDAIRHIIGFYPIAMTMPADSIISVECIQKTQRRYKGRVVDERGLPAEFANIALLSPSDSTVIAGGVSNADGFLKYKSNCKLSLQIDKSFDRRLQVVYNFNAKRSKYRGTGAGNEEKSRL